MAIEDFTTYTEVDPNSHIGLVGTNHIDFDAYGNEDAYRYKDKGAGHFTDFEHKVDVRLISGSEDYCYGGCWMLSNDIDDINGLCTAGKSNLHIRVGRWPTDQAWILLDENYLGTHYYTYYVGIYNTWYYLTIKKTGTALECEIYSDSARTNLLSTLALTLHDTYNFRYIFAAATYNENQARVAVLDIENLDLQEAPAVGPSRAYIIG